MALRWAHDLVTHLAVTGACLLIVSPGFVMAQGSDFSHAVYDRLLKAYVANGRVNYAGLKADPTALGQYLDQAAEVPEAHFKTWSEAQQLAYLINVYNASTLKLVVEHYPLKSIKEIGGLFKGPWDQPAVRIFGQTITLNTLEHGIIRKRYREPRIHMALVCAAKGCPPLRNEAYVADRLNEQLDDQSRIYLSSPAGLQIDRAKGEARLSSIFKWYSEDFPSVSAFVARYAGQNMDGLKIGYLEYDWSLNNNE